MRRIGSIVLTVYVCLYFAIFLTRADGYLNLKGYLPVPRSVLVAVLSMPLVFYSWAFHHSKRDGEPGIIQVLYAARSIFVPFLLLIAWVLISTLMFHANWDQHGYFITLFVNDLFVFVLSLIIATPVAISRHWRLIVRFALFCMVASILIDLVRPGTFSPLTSRGAGFAVNANMGAFFTAILLAGSLEYGKFQRNLLYLIPGGLAILATLSRGGAVLFALILVVLTICIGRKNNFMDLKMKAVWKSVAVAVCLIVAIYVAFQYGKDRSDFVGSLLSNNRVFQFAAGTLSGSRGEPRLKLLHEYFYLIGEKPLTGWGAGFSGTRALGPHNEYLLMWVNHGLVGLVVYLWFVAGTLLYFLSRRLLEGFVVAIAFAVEGLFSHTLFEQQPLIVLLALLVAATCSGGSRYRQPGIDAGGPPGSEQAHGGKVC